MEFVYMALGAVGGLLVYALAWAFGAIAFTGPVVVAVIVFLGIPFALLGALVGLVVWYET